MPDISDADTFTLVVATIRLHGIDAPELGQSCERPEGGTWRCDVAATNLLEELIGKGRVTCILRDVDVYGRMISVCEAYGADLAGALVDSGLAWAFVRYSDDYVEREAEARDAQVGIWRGGAQPGTPWDYRANRWDRAAASSPREGCPIKGNISANGERIYHTPWSPWYNRTSINVGPGERWFCDEAEAVAAGWRPGRAVKREVWPAASSAPTRISGLARSFMGCRLALEVLYPPPEAPMAVVITEYAQLTRLCWNLPGVVAISGAQALSIYEERWRHLDESALDAKERALIDRLVHEHGNGHLCV